MEKHEALLRDIAKLFVKYGPEEWRSVISLLRTSGPTLDQFASAIETVQRSNSQRRAASVEAQIPKKEQRQAKETTVSLPLISDGVGEQRAEALGRLYRAIQARELLPETSEIRDAYLRSGGKETIPSKRVEAAKSLVRHLASLPDPAFEAALHHMFEHRGDLQQDYSRWFEMIYKREGGPETV